MLLHKLCVYTNKINSATVDLMWW